MDNLSVKVANGKMVVTVEDLSKRLGQSASGKSEIVASTHGNIKVDGTDVVLSFNAYVKR
jgi:hypothetical protein